MRLAIVPAALAELHAAATFYAASGGTALGLSFIAEYERATGAILVNPNIGAPFHKLTRRIFLRRFPYGVIYRMGGEELLVVAVAHERRRPEYWAARK